MIGFRKEDLPGASIFSLSSFRAINWYFSLPLFCKSLRGGAVTSIGTSILLQNRQQRPIKKPSFVSFPLINRGLFRSSFQEITSFEKDQKFGFFRPTQKIHLESLSTGKMQSHQTNKTSQVKDLSFCFGRQKSFKNWLGVRQGQYQWRVSRLEGLGVAPISSPDCSSVL